MTKNNNPSAIITGASSGIGEALAFELGSRNFNLTINARREDRLSEVREQILKAHPEIDVLINVGDVSQKADNQRLIEQSLAHFGRLDTFIANAGIGMWTRFRDIADPDAIKDLMQLNFMGVVYGLFYALPALRTSHGSFVAVSSVQGVIPVPYHCGYVASKYAVNGFIEAMRFEEPEVHLMLALPGWIKGTELRAHSLTGSGQDAIEVKAHGQGNHAISKELCAQKIVEALLARQNQVYIPKDYRRASLLRALMPGIFDRVVKAKVDKQVKQK